MLHNDLVKEFWKTWASLRCFAKQGKTGAERLNEKYPHKKSSTGSDVNRKFVSVKYAGEIVSGC